MRSRRALELDEDEFKECTKHRINPILSQGYVRTYHFLECKSVKFEYEGETIWTVDNATATIDLPAGVGVCVYEGKCRGS
ncbi:hypothetical protein IWW34DRAFT_638253 [Fusarium oxysporum f. sp. albedinis]|nr:hypothetical protein IWW34DRAFT_638253 [Fusarium oxysporum f. sp. albedinis]